MSRLVRGTPVIVSRKDLLRVLEACPTLTGPAAKAHERLSLLCEVWDPNAKMPSTELGKRIQKAPRA